MNSTTKTVVTRILLVASLLSMNSNAIFAKKGLLGKIGKFLTNNPLKPFAKVVRGPNNFVPIDYPDFKKGIYGENFSVVEKGKLYRSAQLSPQALKAYIKKYGIKTIINLRGEHPKEKWWRQEKSVADRYHVTLVNIPTSAVSMISKESVDKILQIFDTAPRPILVHCMAGIDRTGEVSALWVLDQQKKSKSEARKQLSMWHGHILYPKKDKFIESWRGRAWFYKEYDPKKYA
jgi:protein tyrosine phosphatase (PTP) superfamily phosphohydrolase (DUF442 family)